MIEQSTLDRKNKSQNVVFWIIGVTVGVMAGAIVASLISASVLALGIGALIGFLMCKEMANVALVFAEDARLLFTKAQQGNWAKGLLGIVFIAGVPLYFSIQLMASFIQKLIYPVMYRIHGEAQRTYFVKKSKKDGSIVADVDALAEALNSRLTVQAGQSLEAYLKVKSNVVLAGWKARKSRGS